jgi:hypothetical protein
MANLNPTIFLKSCAAHPLPATLGMPQRTDMVLSSPIYFNGKSLLLALLVIISDFSAI